MQLGFVGLGKMGANMVERLLRRKHDIVVYSPAPEIRDAVKTGAVRSAYLAALHDKVGGHAAKPRE